MTASARRIRETTPDRARALLKSVFGYDDFRPGQADIVAAALAGDSVLAVMPTGSGKSLCYQLPALVEESLTVVVSPLIALMRDQVAQMRALGVAAASLNSLNSADENDETWRAIRSGALRLLYLSPERLATPGLAQALARAPVRRIAVDEAHCISEWGHDFRPEYRLLRDGARAMGDVQIIAFTATADRATRADIVERLFDAPPRIVLHSFDRPNIALRFAAKEQPRRQLLDFLKRHRGESGIVYCASRKRTQALADFFNAQGFDAVAYHAGLEQGARHAAQDRFLREDGVIAVATVAFGMGVNKPDVRFVAHADMPASVEAYYQEIGRAGRDGLPADTLTLYGLDDMALRRRQIDEKDLAESRRRIEHRRFDALAMLCEAASCRRQALLAYFDEQSGPCGACDVCRGEVKLADGAIAAQKLLSAVMRTGQRFGAGHLADVLTGQATEAVRRNGHDGVRTFGVGADRSRAAWMSLTRQLYAAGALDVADYEHGGFRLTEKGDAILRGREGFLLREEAARPAGDGRGEGRRRGRGATPTTMATDAQTALLAALKALRREIAQEEGAPAFMVFGDRTLIDMAERAPRNMEEMAEVFGVGARKLERYGEAFLAVVLEHA